jgi:PAB-dependent poly(A)-specific ribonuclease subunit 2
MGMDSLVSLRAKPSLTNRKGHPLPDPLIRLYDIRTLRPLPPVSFPAGPGFCRLHPSDSSKLVIASQQGMLQTYDMAQGSDSNVFSQLDVSSYVTSMALSNYGDYLAFGDAEGQLHIWTTHDIGDDARDGSGRLKLPPFHYDGGVGVEWPDQIEPPKPFSVEDRT